MKRYDYLIVGAGVIGLTMAYTLKKRYPKASILIIMDFKLEHSKNSTHLLNAVSPAFTCSFSIAEYVADEIEKNRVTVT